MILYLTRWADTPYGIFGTLMVDEGFRCFTVERGWYDNKPFISCIPEGEYPLKPRRYNRGGYDTWEICEVPNRSRILIHKGNLWSDVQGCIAVGSRLGMLDGQWAVLDSKGAFGTLRDIGFRMQSGCSLSNFDRIRIRWKSEGQVRG